MFDISETDEGEYLLQVRALNVDMEVLSHNQFSVQVVSFRRIIAQGIVSAKADALCFVRQVWYFSEISATKLADAAVNALSALPAASAVQ